MKTNVFIVMTLLLTACVEDRIVYEPLSDTDDPSQIISQSGSDDVPAQDQPVLDPDTPAEPEVTTEPTSQHTQDPSG